MPDQLIYVDPLVLIALGAFAVYGLERMFVDVVRWVERRWPSKPVAKPSEIPELHVVRRVK